MELTVNDDLLNSVFNEMQAEITRTIDNDTLCTIMSDNGWHRVDITCNSDQLHAEIKAWIEHNIQCNYRGYYENWVFESKNDAILFALTWGEESR